MNKRVFVILLSIILFLAVAHTQAAQLPQASSQSSDIGENANFKAQNERREQEWQEKIKKEKAKFDSAAEYVATLKKGLSREDEILKFLGKPNEIREVVSSVKNSSGDAAMWVYKKNLFYRYEYIEDQGSDAWIYSAKLIITVDRNSGLLDDYDYNLEKVGEIHKGVLLDK